MSESTEFTLEQRIAITDDSIALFAEHARPLADYYTASDQEEDRQAFISRELGFAAKVLGGISLLAERHTGKVGALFDVDETLARNIYTGSGNEYYTVVRPSVPHVFAAIGERFGAQVEVGLLTSRAQIHVDGEKQNPTYTKSAAHLINPDFMISSRDGSIIKPANEVENEKMQILLRYGSYVEHYDAVGEILDPSALKRDQEVYTNWFDPKLIVLKQLLQLHTDYAFAHVDDLPFAASIDPDHPRLQGIHLGHDAYFTI